MQGRTAACRGRRPVGPSAARPVRGQRHRPRGARRLKNSARPASRTEPGHAGRRDQRADRRVPAFHLGRSAGHRAHTAAARTRASAPPTATTTWSWSSGTPESTSPNPSWTIRSGWSGATVPPTSSAQPDVRESGSPGARESGKGGQGLPACFSCQSIRLCSPIMQPPVVRAPASVALRGRTSR